MINSILLKYAFYTYCKLHQFQKNREINVCDMYHGLDQMTKIYLMFGRHLDSGCGSTWYSSDLNKDHHGNWPRWQEIWYLESNYCNLTQSFQTKSKLLTMSVLVFIFENLFDFLSYYSNQVLLSVNMSNIWQKIHQMTWFLFWFCMRVYVK